MHAVIGPDIQRQSSVWGTLRLNEFVLKNATTLLKISVRTHKFRNGSLIVSFWLTVTVLLKKSQEVFSGESYVIFENWDRADLPNKQFLSFVSGAEMLIDLHTLLSWFESQSLSKTNLIFFDYFKKLRVKENKKYPDKCRTFLAEEVCVSASCVQLRLTENILAVNEGKQKIFKSTKISFLATSRKRTG